MVGKLRAAIAARRDPSFVIFGRTAGIRSEGIEGAVARASVYRDAGVDGIVLLGVKTVEQIEAVHQATGLPLVVGGWRGSLSRPELAARGVKILPQGHLPMAAAIKAMTEAYLHLQREGSRDGTGMEQPFASEDDIERLLHEGRLPRLAARLHAIDATEAADMLAPSKLGRSARGEPCIPA